MNERTRLDQAFGRLKSEVIPPPPANLDQNVRRRIRQATEEALDWRPSFWPKWLTNPAFAAVMLTSSITAGVLVAGTIEPDQSRVVDNNFQMTIFTENAPGMLHPTLLSHSQ